MQGRVHGRRLRRERVAAVRFDDVRGCLRKLALVGSHDPHIQDRGDANHAAGGGFGRPPSIVVGKTVVVSWSAEPTARQRRRLEACLEA